MFEWDKESAASLAKTNYIASMISFGAVALSNLAPNLSTFYQNIALSFGLMTGLSAIIAIQLVIHEEVKASK